MLGRLLMLRAPEAEPAKQAVAARFAVFDSSPRAVLQEKLSASLSRRPTLNLEGMFLWSVLGTRLRNLAFRAKQSQIVRLQRERPGARLLDAVIRDPKPGASLPTAIAEPVVAAAPEAPPVAVLEYGNTRPIHHNISGLTLDVSSAHPKRVNLLLAMIDFKYVFGGYLGMFNLALRLRREGYQVRIILHERSDWDMDSWRQQIKKYPGITTLFDEIEVISRFDRAVPVPAHPEDRFVATNCWAAHIAHETVQALQEKRFLFMIQEYEPYFLPMNSISALFQQAYDFPQVALFSTALLADFFRREKIGVFKRPGGEADAAIFSNAIQKFHPKRETLQRSERRLLVYARPEEHAARNLFELAMIALAKLARDPRISLENWSFHGIGSIDRRVNLELAPGLPLQLLPKTSLQEYIDMMPRFDVGLSLMLTPHPSLVPLEMASAGMWAVTNTFANKTSEALAAISSNLIGVAPTVDAIVDGLVQAMQRVDDLDARLAGAEIDWPVDWDAAFPLESLDRMRRFLGPRGAEA
ncbi:rhamnosyltransferase WsaF family glycosyltransferase [Acidisoma sp. 7E03]